MKIIIVGRGTAGSILKDTEQYSDITHVVSIGANEKRQKKPNGFDVHPAKKLRLEFFDINCEKRQDMNGPTIKDIEKLVDFYQEALKTKSPCFLIHCWAGISRSTAAGLILLMMRYKDKEKAVKELFLIKPNASPNTRMVKLAHEVLADRQIISEKEKE